GQPIDTSDLVLSIEGERVSDADFSGDDWETGSSETLTHGKSDDGEYELRIIHEPSGNSIYQTTIDVPSA
ncbi:MAG: type IV pilin, partial [Halorubrum sp.]